MAELRKVNRDSMVDLLVHLKWRSAFASHTDGYQARRINLWRDILPPALLEQLLQKEAGDSVQVPLVNGDAVGTYSDNFLFEVLGSQFDRRLHPDTFTEPRVGRFYPKGLLKGVSGVFKENLQPFRCVGLNNGKVTVDFNHPLAGKPLELSAIVGKIWRKESERGGISIDWLETLTEGPGMQARWQREQTDYFSEGAFDRDDSRADSDFYRETRLVHHIDATAREVISNTYGRFLESGMRVLDLMSSWESHVPSGLRFERLTGLGLNADELNRNARLTDYLVHDLNSSPEMPYADGEFDAVINTVSVEYLTRPLEVFGDVRRILRPGGYFVVTFSNRWFPTKAIRLWKEIHEFERMGLVLEYFLRAGGFGDLNTYSFRGLPRPHDDRHYPQLRYADPVYAVWGRKL